MTDCDGVKKGIILPGPYGLAGMFSFMVISSGPRQVEDIVAGDF